MKNSYGLIIAFFIGMISTQVYAEEYDFKPGLWKSTTHMEVEGVPKEMAAMMKMPPRTETECVKKNEFIFKTDSQCKYERKRINKHKMAVSISCKNPEGESKGNGEITFDGKSSSGWFVMNIPNGPVGPMKMKSIFNSKYLGACK